jgi:hypothetical protein
MNKKASRIPIEEYNKIIKEIEEEYRETNPEYKENDLDDIFLQVNNYIRYLISNFNFKNFPYTITKNTPGCFWIDRSQFPDIKSDIALYIIDKVGESLNGLFVEEGLESIYSNLYKMFDECPLLKEITLEIKEKIKYCIDSFDIFKTYLESLD